MNTHRSSVSYLKWPLITTVVGLGLTGWLGWATKGDWAGILSFLMVGTVLAALEIALSFDNAIVNANKLEEMDTDMASTISDLGNSHCCFWNENCLSTCYRSYFCLDKSLRCNALGIFKSRRVLTNNQPCSWAHFSFWRYVPHDGCP